MIEGSSADRLAGQYFGSVSDNFWQLNRWPFCPLEREVERTGPEQTEQRERAGAGAIHGDEVRVLARLQVEVERFPEERVVCAEAVRAGWHVARHFMTEQQCGQRFTIERHHNLPVSDVRGSLRETVSRAGRGTTVG